MNTLSIEVAGALTYEEATTEYLRSMRQLPARITPASAEDLATQVAEALRCIPADGDYNRWITVLAALYHRFGAATAVQLGEQWSGYCSKPGEVEAKINSFRDDYGATPADVGTIFHIAEQYGYTPPRKVRRDMAKRRKKQPAPIRQRIVTPPATEDGAIPVQYVSDDLTPAAIRAEKSLLIIAPVGLGKTSAIADDITARPDSETVSGIAQYRALTQALAVKLQANHYEDADGAHQRGLGAVSKLVTSVSSAYKFKRPPGGVVVVDEVEGVLQFCAASSTFRGGEAPIAYRALKTLTENAEQLYCMDANASEIAVRWLEKRRGALTVKRYRAAKARGKVTFLRGGAAVGFYMIGKLLAHQRGLVGVPCSSERDATAVSDYFTEQGYRVLKVTSDTSNTPAVKAARASSGERAAYDLIVYDSAWGAGVDIAEPFYAVVGIFTQQPLAPEGALQLFGRIRHAARRYAVVPPDSIGYETASAEALLMSKLQRERYTARLRNRTPQDSGDYLELAQLWAEFEARKLRETAQWRLHFARRLEANGFTVAANHAPAPKAYADALTVWRAEREQTDWDFILGAVEQALPDADLNGLKMRGVEIDHALKLRNVRYKIEQALAVRDVTDQDRDLVKGRNRARHYRLCDLVSDEAATLSADDAQAAEGRPIHQRRYHTVNNKIIAKLLALAGHTGATPEAQLLAFEAANREYTNADVIDARYAVFTAPDAMRLFKELGHHGNNAKTAHGLYRWLCEHLGLQVNARRGSRDADGQRPMQYRLDPAIFAYRLARARRAVRERSVDRNVHLREEYTFLSTPTSPPPPPAILPPPGPDFRAEAKAGGVINPFSEGWKPRKERTA